MLSIQYVMPISSHAIHFPMIAKEVNFNQKVQLDSHLNFKEG